MYKRTLTFPAIAISVISLLIFLFSCQKEADNKLAFVITTDTLSMNYAGNGIQWDAYPEAESWGTAVSDADWQKLFERVGFMRPGFVRCLINSPFRYYDKSTGKYDKTRNIESLSKLLQFCQDNQVTVLFGEYNPPEAGMKEDPAWIDMAVDYLNYLVSDLGFTCIKHYTLFNEPDGYWSSNNGQYDTWRKMVMMFRQKMNEYPGLADKVSFAAPDIVVGYRNPESEYAPYEWIKQSASDMDSITGIYEVHAYPGQYEVRSGSYAKTMQQYLRNVPKGKQLVLGEAGFKYYQPEDSLIMKEQLKRISLHRNTRGSDCNMMVYDFFYGLDMPLLCMEMINAGLSGMAVWMLDDAMHSNGDAGDTTDIKIWGMWNILGEEVFNNPAEEAIRPWYYSWSLMCRYFPRGTTMLKIQHEGDPAVTMAAGTHNGKLTLAMVNTGNSDQRVKITLPQPVKNARQYIYAADNMLTNPSGLPVPAKTGIKAKKHYETTLRAQSFVLLTEIEW